jgi:uncharacterized protein YchJ
MKLSSISQLAKVVVFVVLEINAFRINYYQSHKYITNSAATELFAGFGSKEVQKPQNRIPEDGNVQCACGSKLSYAECCKPFHDGTTAPSNPVQVVRSRFSALSYSLPAYIIATTHPKHKEYVNIEQSSKRRKWEKDLYEFIETYKFISLSFDDEAKDSNPTASSESAIVSFTAKIQKISTNRSPEDMKVVSSFSFCLCFFFLF